MSAGREQASDVEPGVRLFMDRVQEGYARLAPEGAADVIERRRIAEEVRAPWTEGGPAMASTTNLMVGSMDVAIRIHQPTGDPDLPCLIYVHGGGWMLFSIDTHDRLMREYAHRANINVIGVDYSRAPEARFPVALEEVRSVIDWLRSAEGARLLRPQAVAIGGDSAGGNLAIATNLALRDAGAPPLQAMLLNYGAFDTERRPSHLRYDGPAFMLTADEMADFWHHYLDGENLDNPLARPLLADLTGLPPAFLCVAECDILLDENREMERRLRDAGVPVVTKIYAGATHSFLEAVSESKLADQALADASAWLAGVLRR